MYMQCILNMTAWNEKLKKVKNKKKIDSYQENMENIKYNGRKMNLRCLLQKIKFNGNVLLL